MNDSYRFQGIAGFVPAAEGISPQFRARIPSDFFVSRAADALTQLSLAPAEVRPAMLAAAREARAALALALATVDAAIAEVETACLPTPTPNPTPLFPPAPAPAPAPSPPPTPKSLPARRSSGPASP